MYKIMQFNTLDLGLIDFAQAELIQRNSSPDTLIFCRHNPVITLGRRANRNNILASEEELERRGIKIYVTGRGGEVTYHGPGQLMAYPIFNLCYFKKDIRLFLRYLEEAVIGLLSDFGIKAVRIPNLTGVWVDKQKIASIGIAIRHWISFHGLSLNVQEEDLENFRLIRPCGMDIEMTSLETVLGRGVQIDQIKEKLRDSFQHTVFDLAGSTRGSY